MDVVIFMSQKKLNVKMAIIGEYFKVFVYLCSCIKNKHFEKSLFFVKPFIISLLPDSNRTREGLSFGQRQHVFF